MSWILGNRRLNWPVIVCTILLAAIGLAAIERGDQIAENSPLWHRQIAWLLLAGIGLVTAITIPYRRLQPASYTAFLLCLLLLGAVYLTPAKNGAHRWLPLGLFDFQPSEVTKLAFVCALANNLVHRRNDLELKGLLVPLGMALVPVGLILREPDLGTSLVFLPVLFAMLFAAGARVRHLVLVLVFGVGLAPCLWLGMSAEQKSRVVELFVQRDGGPAPTGDGYHLHQSKQVLALGGVRGSRASGPLLDDPLAYHLPAARTDFIFCLVGERFGLIGTASTLCVYLMLFFSGLRIAAATREPFGRLVSVGVVALLATQTIINTAMTVGLMPVTGITLPLVSHGGSSLASTAFGIGILLNVGMRRGYEITSDPFGLASLGPMRGRLNSSSMNL